VDGQVVVITGGSSGIGAATGERLAHEGAAVVLVARRKDALEEVVARCDGNALAVVADMTRRAEVKEVVRTALDTYGRIDVWINNVGRGINRPPSELTDDDVDQIMRDNVMTALYGIQEVLTHFRARNAGHIVNISSLLGRVPFATYRSAYCGAKHFLNALTATLRAELAESHPGICVSLVSPGVVRTPFGLNALHGGPDSRQLPGSQGAEEVAAVISDVIATRVTDAYTSKGAHDRIAGYYASIGTDP
jgi:NADP-dependent 3-hydroxy acid dehydrogenase YdfG